MTTGNLRQGMFLFYFAFNSSDTDCNSVRVAQYNRQRTALGVKKLEVNSNIDSTTN